MVNIYARKIANGTLTLSDVPERWRNAVAALSGGDKK